MSFHPDYEDILSMHLKGGAPIEGFNYALCRLASRSTEAIQVMLDRDINVSALRDFTGDTPLHYAIRNFRVTNIAVCEMLVKVCDVDIEARNTSGDSCLDCAILHHNSAALCWLINVGANINCHNLAYLHLIENYRCAIILLAAGGALNFVDAISDSQLSTATLIDKMPIPIIHAIIGAFNNTDNVIISLLFSTSVSRANVDTNLVNRSS
jgi:ankyrin repeat protein